MLATIYLFVHYRYLVSTLLFTLCLTEILVMVSIELSNIYLVWSRGGLPPLPQTSWSLSVKVSWVWLHYLYPGPGPGMNHCSRERDTGWYVSLKCSSALTASLLTPDCLWPTEASEPEVSVLRWQRPAYSRHSPLELHRQFTH